MTEKQEAELYELLEDYGGKLERDEIYTLVEGIKQIHKRNTFNSKVQEFHETFNQIVAVKPSIPVRSVQELRLSLILEELSELAEAMGPDTFSAYQRMLFKKSQEVHYKSEQLREKMQPNLIEVIDALADLQYVLSGAIVATGFTEKFEEAFHEVHESNMSKACITHEEANATIEAYANKDVISKSVESNGKILVLREPDGKVLKSVNYKAAKLERFCYDSI